MSIRERPAALVCVPLPKNCLGCGIEFIPAASNQVRCPGCQQARKQRLQARSTAKAARASRRASAQRGSPGWASTPPPAYYRRGA
jgi:hypothetical protein